MMVASRNGLEHEEGCIDLPILEETTSRLAPEKESSPSGVRGPASTPDTRDTSSSFSSSSPASPATPAIDMSTDFTKDSALEERVQDLESKLATLSLLLQQQRRLRSVSPITPPLSPTSAADSNVNTPPLDSPAPTRPHRRNLSFRVLHASDLGVLSPAPSRSNFLPQSLLESQPSSPSHQMFAKITEAISPINTSKEEENEEPPKKDKDVKGKWLDYLNSFQESNYDTDKQMEEFVKVPSAVEALLSFGFWICVDSFLYILTILPIRFVWSCLLLIRYILIRLVTCKNPSEGPYRFHRRYVRHKRTKDICCCCRDPLLMLTLISPTFTITSLPCRHSYQLIQVSIIYIIYKYVLLPVSIGKLYHWIRGQAMVKLYVLIAMVEIFDRLMCSLGQDCLDSLYWNTTRRPRSSRLIVSVAVVIIYTMVHSFLLFVHVATLNVAMNSDDQALLSLLIGGNFAEIKSTVFKKYNKANLFKITASDICERFKLALFLAIVLALNMSQGMDEKMVYNYFHMCGIVWCAEWLSDWIKHSFITKFNFISSNIYPEYGLLLAGDVTGIGHEGANLDQTHAVVRRIGLAQIPLVCVMARYLKEAYKYATYDSQPPVWMIAVGFFAVWLFLLVCKLSLGSFLHKISQAKLEAAPEFSSKNATVAKKKKD
jgi:hypothetical protein